MSMSTESRAKLAGMQSSEWNKFIKSYVGAQKEFEKDRTELDTAIKNEYDLMSGLSTLAFVLTSSMLGDTDMAGWKQMAIAGGVAMGTAGVVDYAIDAPELAAAELESKGYDVYNPMFNKTRAWEMEEGIKTDQATAVTAYDQYQGDSWKGIGMETASQMGSFALSPGGPENMWPWQT